jgi:hypothetical protein
MRMNPADLCSALSEVMRTVRSEQIESPSAVLAAAAAARAAAAAPATPAPSSSSSQFKLHDTAESLLPPAAQWHFSPVLVDTSGEGELEQQQAPPALRISSFNALLGTQIDTLGITQQLAEAGKSAAIILKHNAM